jgi:DNA (cytosine-5)-methyltransferase 1
MFPELVRAVVAIKPRAFVAENVTGLATTRFREYISRTIGEPLGKKYVIRMFTLEASAFGVPQRRRRVFFVGFLDKRHASFPASANSWLHVGVGPERTVVRAIGM